mgnify:CR=1 FL=1|jgi:hypothetical protein
MSNGLHTANMRQHDTGAAGSASNSGDGRPFHRSVPVAIVGMACKFGGDATSPSKLWDMCVEGQDGWGAIPHERFDLKSLYHPDQQRFDRVSHFPPQMHIIELSREAKKKKRKLTRQSTASCPRWVLLAGRPETIRRSVLQPFCRDCQCSCALTPIALQTTCSY